LQISLDLRPQSGRLPDDYNRPARDVPELARVTSWVYQGGGSSGRAVFSAAGEPDPVAFAERMARMIAGALPGITVTGVDEDRRDRRRIAAAARVSAQTVAEWIQGRGDAEQAPFPQPRYVPPGRGAADGFYSWPEVVTWLRETVGIDPEPGIRYLTAEQAADLNSRLAAVPAVAVQPAGYLVSIWPPGHDCEDTGTWSLRVTNRGNGEWSVGRSEGQVLGGDGQWHRDQPGHPDLRFSLGEALQLARSHAFSLKLSGVTAAEAVRAHSENGCPHEPPGKLSPAQAAAAAAVMAVGFPAGPRKGRVEGGRPARARDRLRRLTGTRSAPRR